VLVVALVARFASVIYYVKYYIGDDGQPLILIFDRVALFNSFGLLGQILGASLTPFLVKYFDKHRLVFVMSLAHAALLVFSFFTPPEHYWFSVFLHFVGITTFGVTITLLFAMYTDCAEYGEWKSGKRISGLTVSASLFSLKFGSAMGGAIPGFMLGAIGFVANQVQSPETLMGIRLMATILPASLFFVGGLVLLFYKIDRRLLQQMELELAENREQARQLEQAKISAR
jgi:GPH family glycoside/pentoside/hexuronide:cation symporter